jgi:uncharacterized protein YecE (DUF72 family)
LACYYIGTSGWHYEDWQNRFYPKELPKNRWLEFYASLFPTVEINYSFYRLPAENSFASWHAETPAGFIFAVKASRFITHIKRLKNTGEALDKFTARVKILKEKLGPLLFQLPPNMHRNDETLAAFTSGLPQGYKYVIEFRHGSWFTGEVYKILQEHNVGMCVFTMPDFDSPLISTADFAYIRFHGSDSLYASSYTDTELSAWSEKITRLGRNLKEVFIYFNNDVSGFALNNAITLQTLLGEAGQN